MLFSGRRSSGRSRAGAAAAQAIALYSSRTNGRPHCDALHSDPSDYLSHVAAVFCACRRVSTCLLRRTTYQLATAFVGLAYTKYTIKADLSVRLSAITIGRRKTFARKLSSTSSFCSSQEVAAAHAGDLARLVCLVRAQVRAASALWPAASLAAVRRLAAVAATNSISRAQRDHLRRLQRSLQAAPPGRMGVLRPRPPVLQRRMRRRRTKSSLTK